MDSQPDRIADQSFFYQGSTSTGVLLIHGLAGTPTEMRFVGKGLAKAGLTVSGMQLAGHCGSEADLLATGRQDWIASAEAAFLRLKNQVDHVFICGLSMGAVLALKIAGMYPDAVRGVGLYSTTLRYDGWAIPRLSFLLPLVTAIPFFGARYRFVESFPYGIKDERLREYVLNKMREGHSGDAGLMSTPGPSLRELRRMVAEVKGLMPSIKVPALVVHASDDDVTGMYNCRYLERNLGGPVKTVLLDDSYHMITVDKQRDLVVRNTAEFVSRQLPAWSLAS